MRQFEPELGLLVGGWMGGGTMYRRGLLTPIWQFVSIQLCAHAQSQSLHVELW